MKKINKKEELFTIATHSCYEPDPFRVYNESDSKDIEYLEKNPSMYTIVKTGLTEEEVNSFFKNLEVE